MSEPVSEYLQYLPATFQGEPEEALFLARFLRPFQRLLSGLPGTEHAERPGIEQLLDRIHTFFLPGPALPDAERCPDDFLPWLAGWVGTSLREDWDGETKRRFLQHMPALYRRRGTLGCLREMLEFFLGRDQHLVIDDDGGRPHHFTVRFRVRSIGEVPRCERIAREIIDREKPAHTDYDLIIESPRLQIVDLPVGDGGIRVGRNTLLGVDVKR